ncbi:flocculation protein FLO11-like [Humulus lupulus]|uniref:flocculation protein FLO11-like n=1 Tax=Humulus lupulus TaxID=3486 RepID=UPI002B414BE5|nr:flocculation protein FLO11-like [Humulus lupulus]
MTIEMKKGVLVREHVLSMINMMHEIEIHEAIINERTQVRIILKSLISAFSAFTTNYIMNKLGFNMTDLLNEPQTFESLNKTITKLAEENVIEEKPSTSEDKNKTRKKNIDKDMSPIKGKPLIGVGVQIGEETMVRTRSASSKKTPSSQSRKVPSPSPPPSVSTAAPSVPAPASSVGKTCKSKARKKVFSLSHEHPMVFPDILADIVDVAPPSEVLSQSKKNSVAPKRKLGLDASSSPLTATKKRLKAHPPSLSSSESDPEEEKSKSEATHDTTLSDETVPDNVESEAESDEPEKEDIVPSEQEAESDSEPIATPLSSKAKGKRPISDPTPSPKRSVKEFYANLTNEIIEPKSSLYNKVFVRGHWFSFSPQDIALALHLPLDVEDDDDVASLDKDTVITELVGQKMVWPSNTVISISNLTYTYAVLHKFATTNWKPTSHTTTISFDMTSFLYKVGTGLGINLALVIHDQIIGFRKEDLVAPTTAASYKASAPPSEATDVPSTKKVKPQSLKFASDDIPHASSSVATDSGLVATEIAVVRASIDSLADRVMSIEGLQHSVLEAVQSLSKDPVV